MFFFSSIFLTNFYILLYGKLFNQLILKDKKFSLSENAIFGTLFLSFLGLLINFFFPLNIIVNSTIFIIPFFFLFQKNFFIKKDLFFLILCSIIVYLIIIFDNINRPDAGLYHLPYTQILNEHKIILGLSNLHSRFGHISIIQYLNAINYNFINGLNGILIPLASLMVFIFLYFVNEIYNFLKKKENFNLNHIFCLFILIFICYKINRYSSFGNDATAHLLFFYLISIFLKSKETYHQLNKITLIATYVFLNKITLILSFAFPLFIYIILKKKKNKIFLSFSTFFLILWFLKNILVSSCLVFPIKQTCYEDLSWHNSSQIKKQTILGEAWSKGWPDRDELEISQEEYIKEFNWIKTWYSKHFIYIFKIIFPYVCFLILILLFLNLKKNNKTLSLKFEKKNYKRIYFSLIVSLFGTLIFFLKFPLYRYGYSYIVSSISLFSCLMISNYNLVVIKKICNFVLVISLSIFCMKQILKIEKNYSSNSLIPNIYSLNDKSDKISNKSILIGNNYKVYISKKECMYSQSPCSNNIEKNINHRKFFNYNLIYVIN